MTESLSSKHPRAFIDDLTRPQQKIFDGLQELMAHQESNLAWYHRAGSKVLELQEAVEKRESGWPRKLAGALGISPSSLVKMRKFAADFSRRQAERLDQLGANWGQVLAVAHARTYDRMKLLEEALAKGWGVVDLQSAMKQRFGTRNPGGRPLRKPKTKKQAIQQLQVVSERWLKVYQEVWAGGNDSRGHQLRDSTRQDLRPVAASLADVSNTIQRMQKAVLALARLLGELEQKARRS